MASRRESKELINSNPPATQESSRDDLASAPPAGETKRKSHLPGATFYRLKDATPAGAILSADQYIEDLTRSPLIQELVQGTSVMRLYGYQHPGSPPSFAPFLNRFDKLNLPRIPRLAYVLITEVLAEPRCWYAIAFGAAGRYLLKDELIDVDAHRDVVQRETLSRGAGDVARIKQVRTRIIGAHTTLIQRRASRASTMGEINVDTFAEIVDELDGAPKSREKFGTALSGGQGLTVRRQVSLDDVPTIASDIESAFRETVGEHEAPRRTMFPVKDTALLSQLDETLARMVREPRAGEEVGIAIPDFIRPEDEPRIRFTKMGRGAPLFSDDVRLADYREALRAAGLVDQVDVEYLRAADLVLGADDGGKGRRFSVYQCLTALVEIDGVKYVHYDRSWYGIPADVLEYLDAELANIPLWDGALPTPAARITEPQYNEEAGTGEYLLMDTALAIPVAGQTPVEICDLFTILTDVGRDVATFIHVKRDFSSSSLSHLFEQGRVSAFLLQERAQRASILERVQTVLRDRSPRPSWSRRLAGLLGDAGFQARNVRVVYGIVGNWDGHTLADRLPFFSKIALVAAAHLLRGRDFDVRVARVQMAGPTYSSRKQTKRRKRGHTAAGQSPAPVRTPSQKKASGSQIGRKKASAAQGSRRKDSTR